MSWRWTLTLPAILLGATITTAETGNIEGGCAGAGKPAILLEPITASGEIPRGFASSLERFTERFWDAAMVSRLSEQYPCFDPLLPDVSSGGGSSARPSYALRGRFGPAAAPERVPVLRLSAWSGDHWAREEMVAVHPRGRFVIDFELISVPEGTVYDTGRYTVDWIEPPDADHAYRAPFAPFAFVDGELLPTANTVDYGEWSPDPGEARLPRLEHGDPGVTILRRETLAAARPSPGWLDHPGVPNTLALERVDPAAFSAWAVIRTQSHRWGNRPRETSKGNCELKEDASAERWRSAAFFVALDPEPVVEAIGEGRQFRRYRIQDVHLVDSRLRSSRRDASRRSCETSFEIRECRQDSLGVVSSPPTPSRDGSGNELVVTVDSATGEITGVRLPRWIQPLSWQGRTVCRGGTLELTGSGQRWTPFETDGEFDAPDLLTTAPDAPGLRSFTATAECETPHPAAPGVLEGGCSSRETKEGLNYETSWSWSLHL